MITFALFCLALIFAIAYTFIKRPSHGFIETVLAFLIFCNIGLMGVMAFYSHIFMAEETARLIGWASGSPFQSEIAFANLAFGILGLLALKFRGLFWLATVLGSSIFLLGAFIVHMIQFAQGNTAPYNAGVLVWFGDLLLPILLLVLLSSYLRKRQRSCCNFKEKT